MNKKIYGLLLLVFFISFQVTPVTCCECDCEEETEECICLVSEKLKKDKNFEEEFFDTGDSEEEWEDRAISMDPPSRFEVFKMKIALYVTFFKYALYKTYEKMIGLIWSSKKDGKSKI